MNVRLSQIKERDTQRRERGEKRRNEREGRRGAETLMRNPAYAITA